MLPDPASTHAMCLLFVAYHSHPQWPLIIASNRDEFHRRPTRTAAYWPRHPQWLGGQDLEANGSWLLLDTRGRLAALTNVRQANQALGQVSRGALVTDFVASRSSPTAYAQQLNGSLYSGFNLLTGVRHKGRWQLVFQTNRNASETTGIQALEPGIHGLSNAGLNSHWPKVDGGKQAMQNILETVGGASQMTKALLGMLADTASAQPQDLPDTGVGIATEMLLSSRFIVSETYGTRASTVLLCDQQGRAHFSEHSFDNRGLCTQKVNWKFQFTEQN